MKNQDFLVSVKERIDFLTKEQNDYVSKLININNMKKQYEVAIDNSVGAIMELNNLKMAMEKELNKVDENAKI